MKKTHSKKITTKTCLDYVSGPVKIKDALYMGDELAAKDLDFISSNKITHIINTVMQKIPNQWERFGVQYLSVNWTEKQHNIFDKKNNTLDLLIEFIDEAMDKGQGVLVHSVNGKSRASMVVLAYLMKKYYWSLEKSLQFIKAKKQKLNIRPGFMIQIHQLEKRLAQVYNLSSEWSDLKNQEEKTIVNTFKNLKISVPVLGKTCQKTANQAGKRVNWGDRIMTTTSSSKKSLLTSTVYQESQNKAKKPKSILKGFKDEQQKSLRSHSITIQEKEIFLASEGSTVMTPERNSRTIEYPSSFSINNEKKKKNEQKFSQSQVFTNGTYTQLFCKTQENNYMAKQEPQKIPDSKSNRYSSIPARVLSPGRRDSEKKLESRSGSRLMPYENVISSFKSPYDSNYISKNGILNKKKREDSRKPLVTYQRPSSASQQRQNPVNRDREVIHSAKMTMGGYTDLMARITKEDIIYTASKHKPTWTNNPRQKLLKYSNK